MTLKTKITLGMGFLFAIILLLGGLGVYYLNRLAGDAKAILKDNYISLEYVNTMQKALADGDSAGRQRFEEALRRQENNVTEAGEEPVTETLRRAFDRYRRTPSDSVSLRRVQENLLQLDDINRQAMFRKNHTAERTAEEALVWVALVGTFCFLLVLSFIISFPGYVANPLRELTHGIRQITSRNFEERLHFRSNDELGELARSFNAMAQKLDEYEHSNLARLLFEKKRIDTLIRVMSDGIIGLDQNRYILFVNEVAGRLLGLTEGELVGQYAPDVALHNDLLRTLLQPDPAAADEPALLKIFDGAGGEGKEHYFTRQIQPVDLTRTGDEQPVRAGYVIVLKNITPYKELDLAKTNFIATVSHELKTPIAALKMSLKLLDDERVGSLNDDQRRLLDYARTDADRLLTLTGELLNMAQAEAGQLQLRLQPVAAAELVRAATAALRVAATQKRVSFELHLPDDLPAVVADPDKASWVLINFLSNAVRHSPEEGRVTISVSRGTDFVEFSVRDYGAGIRPEHRDRVFDRYFRAPGSNGQVSGTGLGLTISKEFITAMNGTIGLKGEVVSGAEFFFRLPAV